MKKIFKLLSIIVLCLGCSNSSKYEKQFSKILDYEASNGCFTDEQFDKIFKIIENDTHTFKYDFSYQGGSDEEIPLIGFSQSKGDHMRCVNSDDNAVRAYIVERYGFSGNPSVGFDTRTLIQYRVGDNVYTYRMPDTYSVIERISELADNQYIFIAFYGSIAQGEHNNHQARVYRLDESGVHQLPRVFEKNNHLEDEIVVHWEGKASTEDESDFESTECYDEEDYENELYCGIVCEPHKIYVANTKILKDDDFGEYEVLDGTFKCYCWDGAIFRDVTIMEPYEVKNKDYYIRIEQNKDGSCTYKCWNGGIKSGKPSLTIHGGTRKFWYAMGGT